MSYLVNSAGLYLTAPGGGSLGSFSRYASNPIVTKGAPGSWEDVDIANPDVKWDTISSQWVMNYSGFDGSTWKTGIAYSDDLLAWTKEANNPVFSPNVGEGYIAANGSIISIGTTYYFYYQGGNTPRIYCATSPDLINWTRANSGNAVIDVGAGGQWDDDSVFDPFARKLSDNTVEVFYAGYDGSGNRGVGRATSANGIAFTKQGKILDPDTGDLDNNFGEAAVYGGDTSYVLYHDSSRYVGYRYISKATTLDGTNFTRDWAILQRGTAGQWDDEQVFDPCPVLNGSTLYLFYAGADTVGSAENLNAQIGVAIATSASGGRLTN